MNSAAAKSFAGDDRHARELPEQVFAYGFSFKKRANLQRFAPGSVVHCVKTVKHIQPGSTLLLWGSNPLPDGLRADVHVVRVEDGFLCSVGLGVEVTQPLSWSMDYQGVHYDATRPSDLEQMLQTLPIPPLLLARAAAFRERLVASGITRYGVGNGSWSRPKRTQQVILVPGQLEWDASLRLGNSTVRTNMALLQAVRQANPSAYVVYKPHPDVVAGLRRRDFGERAARTFCNEIVGDVDMGALLRAVNEVHVMTSLTGFEALLRRKVVFCYGMPFYAGWGLTKDLQVNPRRTRQLRLDELVAAALLLYPMYISRSNGARDTPERAVEELLAWRDAAPATLSEWRRRWRGGVRRPENPESSAIHGISDSRCDHPIETTRTFGRTPARTAKS